MGIPLEYGLIQYVKIPAWKYRSIADYSIRTSIKPRYNIVTQFVELTRDGLLLIKTGYAWDGCSGPTYDDDSNQRAGMVHDALYQFMRLELLGRKWRKEADKLLYRCCRDDGMGFVRARVYYRGVRICGGRHTRPGEDINKVCSAP